MGVNLAELLKGYRGLLSEIKTLPSTSVWYQVNIPSDKIRLLLIFNNDTTNDLRIAIVEKGMNPNDILNFNGTHGYFAIPEQEWAGLSVELDIWLQPLSASQTVYVGKFSKKAIQPFTGEGYGE